jgi:transporter family protein
LCAALIPVLGRYGLKSVPSELATVLRSLAMSAVLICFATATGAWSSIEAIRASAVRPLVFVSLTGVAGALSWLCYFKALTLAEASRVAPLDKLSVPIAIVLSVALLGERPTGLNWLGVVLVTIGAIFASLPAR